MVGDRQQSKGVLGTEGVQVGENSCASWGEVPVGGCGLKGEGEGGWLPAEFVRAVSPTSEQYLVAPPHGNSLPSPQPHLSPVVGPQSVMWVLFPAAPAVWPPWQFGWSGTGCGQSPAPWGQGQGGLQDNWVATPPVGSGYGYGYCPTVLGLGGSGGGY